MPSMPDGRTFEYTPEGMGKYRQAVAENMSLQESGTPGRLANTAQSAAAGAAAGAQAGGPWGALIGGTIGAGAGILGVDPKTVQSFASLVPGKKKKKKEAAADELSVEIPKPEIGGLVEPRLGSSIRGEV